MATNGVSLREILTLWYSHKWSKIIVAIMSVATVGDVVFTLLGVARYGIDLEVNPIAKYMIGAGASLTILWIVLNALSVLFIYIPLISLYLRLPTESREGIVSTMISILLASRIAIVLYGAAIFHYSVGETIAPVIIIGVVLMFCIRFTMRHGDSFSLENAKLALVNLWLSFKGSLAGLLSALGGHSSSVYKTRKQRRTEDNNLVADSEDTEGGKPRLPEVIGPQRSRKRIAVILALLIALPITIISILQVIQDVSGIEELEGLARTIVTIGGGTQGSVFLIGFVLALVTVAVMVYLLLALFDELGKEKPMARKGTQSK